MSHKTIAALPALAELQQTASRVNRHKDTLRFRFRRTGVEALPGLKLLISIGASFRVYTGANIYSFKDGEWQAPRRTPKVRAWTTVEVAV